MYALGIRVGIRNGLGIVIGIRIVTRNDDGSANADASASDHGMGHRNAVGSLIAIGSGGIAIGVVIAWYWCW